MALTKATIKAQIITTLQQPFDEETASSSIQDQFADKLADVIIAAIQSATITIPSGTIITTGSAATQTQSTPAVINGALS
jgi:hypothetical protein